MKSFLIWAFLVFPVSLVYSGDEEVETLFKEALQAKPYEESKRLAEVISRFPESGYAYLSQAMLKSQNKNPDWLAVVSLLDKAVNLMPNSQEAFGFRAMARTERQDYNGAIADYSRIIELNANSFLAFQQRGWCKAKVGEYESAIADLDRAIELNPKEADAYFIRSGIKSDHLQGDMGAIADANTGIELLPDHFLGYLARGVAKFKLKDYRGAIADYNKAIKLNPENASAYGNRAMAKANIQDNQGALVDANRALQLNPKSKIAFHARGFAKRHLNYKKDDYCRDFSKAGELGLKGAYEVIQQYCQ